MISLDQLTCGKSAYIVGISPQCTGEPRQRLLDLGFIKGSEIRIQNQSPLGDPTAYLIHNTSIAIRKNDAKNILIELKN